MIKSKGKGLLISFEGGEGAGKTTQIEILARKLRKLGKKIIVVREPGTTDVCEQIREVVLGIKNKGKVKFGTEVMLFQAARAQLYEEVVIPALEKGRIVLSDRTGDSSIIYQGIVRGYGEDKIKILNDISTQEYYPDITFLLDIDVKKGFKRRGDSGKIDRLDLAGNEFHEKVRKGYLKVAKENKGGRWRIINASKSKEEIGEKIWKEVSKLIVDSN